MTLGEFFAYVARYSVTPRPINQAYGHAYGQLYILDRKDGQVFRQSTVTGSDSDELEPEIIERICRDLDVPAP